MNLSEYFILAAIAVAVVFGQQAEQNNLASETISFIQDSSKANIDAGVFPNATFILKTGYENGTKCIAESQEIITNAISKAKTLVLQNPKAAKKLMQQAFENARIVLLRYGIPTAFAYGAALELSNAGALQGIKTARKSVQGAGFSALDAVNLAEVLFDAGNGGNSSQVLLDACQLAVDTGFEGCYKNLKISIQQAYQALRDAQSNSIQGQVKNRTCESGVQMDAETAEAIKDINEAANKALKNGADADLVKVIREYILCALEGYTILTAQGAQANQTMKNMAESDPLTFKTLLPALIEKYTDIIDDLFSEIYFLLGKVALKVGMQSVGLGEAVIALEQAQIKISLAAKSVLALINIGISYGGNGPDIAIDSSVKIGAFIQIDVAQTLAKCANLTFSEL